MTLFAALFSHYRRHPLQLLALVLMIVLATTLWTGVNHLTDRARASLAQSEQAVAGQQQLLRTDGRPVTVHDFAALRRHGLCVMPWLEVTRPAPQGRLIGVDPFSGACFREAVPGQAGSETLTGQPFVDISEAAELSGPGVSAQLSLLTPANVTSGQLPPGYRLAAFSLGPDTGELGESFLLNLDALGVLVLLITALLVRSVYQLGQVQRRESLTLLERFGVPALRIRRLLLAEMVVLATLCVFPGLWLGRWLAQSLSRGFDEAMGSLFDTPLYAGGDGGLAWPAGVMIAVVLVACFADHRASVRGRATGLSVRRWWFTGVLLSGLALVLLATGLGAVFAGVALVFLAVGLLTPPLLSAAFAYWADRGEGMVQWQRKELSVLFRRLALPVVALQFAVAMVLAVQALVTTFEDTFEAWLDQRLEAGLYIEMPEDLGEDNVREGLRYLESLPGLGDWHLVQRGQARLAITGTGTADVSVDLFAISPIGPLVTGWTLIAGTDEAWAQLAAGDGVMVNEQLARRNGYQPGDPLTLGISGETLTRTVVGVYADYGRPAGEILLAGRGLPVAFVPRFRSVSLNPGSVDVEDIRRGLSDVWEMKPITIRDNQSIQALASGVFDQTFLLTRAITVLTLLLAGVALLIMGWVFFNARAWYYRLLSVWGLSRREVASRLRWLALVLTGSVGASALPLGVWLSWVLVARINPLAFGWSLPMVVYPVFWLEMLLMCLVIGMAIALATRGVPQRGAPMPTMANVAGGGER